MNNKDKTLIIGDGNISFQYQNEILKIPVLYMIKDGFGVSLNEDYIATMTGSVLKIRQLEIDHSVEKDLEVIIHTISKQDEGHRVEVQFKGNSDEDRARIWHLYHLHHSLEEGLLPGVTIAPKETPKLPGRGTYSENARRERLKFLRETTPGKLLNFETTNLIPEDLTSNIENFIGSMEIPVGISGPLLLCGHEAQGIFYVPFATTEGALVASATRGATAVTKGGGAHTKVISQQMIRAPLFVFNDLQSAIFFCDWVSDHFEEIKAQTKKVSNYANLLALQAHVHGRSVHLRFIYETGDAAGQNMTTTTTWQAGNWMLKQIANFKHIRCESFLIEANMSSDKKVSFDTFIRGRGIRVVAECVIPKEVCENTLKVTPAQMTEACSRLRSGGIQSGMVGFNINFANVIGAVFMATGQDVACVHESGIGQFDMETVGEDLHASVHLPSLILGTVGGGTKLPHQYECLELLGCNGLNKAGKLAEIIAGQCLALDLSTLAALASGQFATAHEKLGRNRPVNFIKKEELNAAFFEKIIHETQGNATIKVEALTGFKMELGSSILTELTGRMVNKLVGHFPFEMTYSDAAGQHHVKTIVKVKPNDAETILMLNSMAGMCEPLLAAKYAKYKEETGFKHCHVRELEIYKIKDPKLAKFYPKTYGVCINPQREIYLVMQECLENMVLMDTADDVHGWEPKHIEAAIEGMAEFHSWGYGREEELHKLPWLEEFTRDKMFEMDQLWELFATHARDEFPEWFTKEDLKRHRDLIYTLHVWSGRTDRMTKTMIHNDFNPRNICFRNDGKLTLCAYDWELATIQIPQHDLAELLIFTMNETTEKSVIDAYVEKHRLALEKYTGMEIKAKKWQRGFVYSLCDLTVNRISMYIMAHTFRHYHFMERCYTTLRHLLDLYLDDGL